MVQIYLDKLTTHRSGPFTTHCLLGWGFVPQLHKTLVSLWPTTDFWGFFLRAPENLGLVNCRPTTSTGLPLMGPCVNAPHERRLWRVSWIGKCLTVGVSLPSIFAVSLGLPQMPITWGGLPALLALYWAILCRCLYNGVNAPRGLFSLDSSIRIHTLWGNNSHRMQSPLGLKAYITMECCLVLQGNCSWHCHHHPRVMQSSAQRPTPWPGWTNVPVSHLKTLPPRLTQTPVAGFGGETLV
jgi:hypothetical protein